MTKEKNSYNNNQLGIYNKTRTKQMNDDKKILSQSYQRMIIMHFLY
jgi:hypothetical protein